MFAREHTGRRSIEDILGWNHAFYAEQVAQDDLEQLADAGVLESAGARVAKHNPVLNARSATIRTFVLSYRSVRRGVLRTRYLPIC